MEKSSVKPCRTKGESFPTKLFKILSNPHLRCVITWLPHGRSWRILHHLKFEKYVISKYFRHCKLSSFMRQVNGWGFRRISEGPDRNSYYHESFLRGRMKLCRQMRRPGSDELRKLKAHSSVQPDFYEMSKNDPLPEENITIGAAAYENPCTYTAHPISSLLNPCRAHELNNRYRMWTQNVEPLLLQQSLARSCVQDELMIYQLASMSRQRRCMNPLENTLIRGPISRGITMDTVLCPTDLLQQSFETHRNDLKVVNDVLHRSGFPLANGSINSSTQQNRNFSARLA